MEFKGTKGKFSVKTCYYSKPIIKIENENREVFAVVPFRDNYVHLHSYEMSNALLISKAPEMLEMLVKIKSFIDDNKDKNYMIELLNREVSDLEQLIKQATEL